MLKKFFFTVLIIMSCTVLPKAVQPLGKKLIDAIAQGQFRLSKRLIKIGANVNYADAAGDTPLHKAALWGNVGLVRLLLSKGAKAYAINNSGYTPLMSAADGLDDTKGSAEAARLLVDQLLIEKKRAFINRKDKEGKTALEHAIFLGSVQIVELLVKYASKDDIQAALKFAKKLELRPRNYPQIIRILTA